MSASSTLESDLVRDSRLATEFLAGGAIQHTIWRSDRSGGRRTLKKETWRRASDKQLGKGSFGQVWLERSCAGRVRALKAIRKEASLSVVHYARELEAAAKFSHDRYVDCFVESYGWFEDEKHIYLSMEYLQYGDLGRFLGKEFSEKEAKDVTFQLVQGLGHMHENDFVHRDLKPENILVAHPGPRWWVKIADFGISKRAREGAGAGSTMVGTARYCAPEVLRKDNSLEAPYKAVRDMWALGEVLFRILTKRPAFEEDYDVYRFTDGHETFDRQIKILSEKGISSECSGFVQQLLISKPKERMTASEAAQHSWLQPAALPSPSSSRPSSPSFSESNAPTSPSVDTIENTFLLGLDSLSQGSVQWSTAALDEILSAQEPSETSCDDLPTPTLATNLSDKPLQQTTEPSKANTFATPHRTVSGCKARAPSHVGKSREKLSAGAPSTAISDRGEGPDDAKTTQFEEALSCDPSSANAVQRASLQPTPETHTRIANGGQNIETSRSQRHLPLGNPRAPTPPKVKTQSKNTGQSPPRRVSKQRLANTVRIGGNDGLRPHVNHSSLILPSSNAYNITSNSGRMIRPGRPGPYGQTQSTPAHATKAQHHKLPGYQNAQTSVATRYTPSLVEGDEPARRFFCSHFGCNLSNPRNILRPDFPHAFYTLETLIEHVYMNHLSTSKPSIEFICSCRRSGNPIHPCFDDLVQHVSQHVQQSQARICPVFTWGALTSESTTIRVTAFGSLEFLVQEVTRYFNFCQDLRSGNGVLPRRSSRIHQGIVQHPTFADFTNESGQSGTNRVLNMIHFEQYPRRTSGEATWQMGSSSMLSSSQGRRDRPTAERIVSWPQPDVSFQWGSIPTTQAWGANPHVQGLGLTGSVNGVDGDQLAPQAAPTRSELLHASQKPRSRSQESVKRVKNLARSSKKPSAMSPAMALLQEELMNAQARAWSAKEAKESIPDIRVESHKVWVKKIEEVDAEVRQADMEVALVRAKIRAQKVAEDVT